MAIDIIFDIFADNPPSILIGGGVVGWILCGFTNIDIFCFVWPWLLGIGIVLQILWLIFN
jgi:hypothetical protein